MKTLKKIVFWLHLVAGIFSGSIVLVMAVTGLTLAYERQITDWADDFKISGEPTSSSLEIGELLPSTADPALSGILFEKDPQRPVALKYGREKTEFYDPYTGIPLGEGNTAVRSFFHTVVGLHRWLGLEGAARPVGKTIVGIANLIFLFLIISGIFIWLPKKWTIKTLRSITLWKRGLKGKARDWRLHNVAGIWAALPLLVIVPCGTVIAFPWASDLVYKIVGETPPPHGKKKRGHGKPEGPAIEINTRSLDQALATAKAEFPEWQTIQMDIPPKKFVTVSISDMHRGRPDKRREIRVNSKSGEIEQIEDFSSLSTGRQARTWIRWIHTGEAGGMPGQTLAGLSAASTILLIWSGFALSWRRFRNRRRKTAQ
ncbi:PepSY-associated TM helix domain-containing protein [Luteolibacter sp. AS25]|uniref:PepSY-associated TM helix domain-containing protein n=1 Tax=Luteolibacter sp. AS25 TaxID=3135776 RepID=UPI00398BAC21